MKKNFLAIAAIVFAIAASAFTHREVKPRGDLTTYKWKNLLVTPQVYVNGGALMTQADAQADYFSNCTGGSTHCAEAYNSSDQPQGIFINKTP